MMYSKPRASPALAPGVLRSLQRIQALILKRAERQEAGLPWLDLRFLLWLNVVWLGFVEKRQRN